jgi:hypothetical protein
VSIFCVAKCQHIFIPVGKLEKDPVARLDAELHQADLQTINLLPKPLYVQRPSPSTRPILSG